MNKNEEIRKIINALEALIDEPKSEAKDLAEKCASDQPHLLACRVNLAIRKIIPNERFHCIDPLTCVPCMIKMFNGRCPLDDERIELTSFMQAVDLIDDERRLQRENTGSR